jgi:hypothetical protein
LPFPPYPSSIGRDGGDGGVSLKWKIRESITEGEVMNDEPKRLEELGEIQEVREVGGCGDKHIYSSSTPTSSTPSTSPTPPSLEELIWTLEASQGEFRLILARCNYIRLRSRLVKDLQNITNFDIEIINLKKTDVALYQTIAAQVADSQKEAVMVLGLESLQDLAQLLSTTNQVREEFRKNFPFPLVLWVTDEVLAKLIRLASDFESWATTVEFTIATDELIQSLEYDTNAIFAIALASDIYSIGWQMGYLRRREIIRFYQDLQLQQYQLEPRLEASVNFVRGQDAYLQNQTDIALAYYGQSLEYWEKRDWGVESGEWGIEEEERVSDSLVYPTSSTPVSSPTSSTPYSLTPHATTEGRQGVASVSNSATQWLLPTPPPSTPLHQNPKLRAGVLFFYIGLCYFQKAELNRTDSRKYLLEARYYFKNCICTFTEGNRPNLIAKFINPLGEVLQRLEVWDELQILAENALDLQQLYGNSMRVARAYGFLAEVAINKHQWLQAKQYAYRALHHVAKNQTDKQQYQSLYLLLLAQAEQNLDQTQRAVQHLQQARDIGNQDNPQQYIRILQVLRSQYLQQNYYLEAFRTKSEIRSIEQQYGFRAFIGAGKIQPRRQPKFALTQIIETLQPNSLQPTVAPEITASGRQRDIDRLIERIARPDNKLIVIHGYSGVGKTSLVQAGLIPTLKQRTIGIQKFVPILVRFYTNWKSELGKLLINALKESQNSNILPTHLDAQIDAQKNILTSLQEFSANNSRIILIFDQFEEFFFVYKTALQRQGFFTFLDDCLSILGVKVILALREDYLHYLLECNRIPNLNILGNDILSKNILYQLGNFASVDAKSLIEKLTQNSNSYLEPELITKLVQDLAAKFGEVRPIELQIVGAQLHSEDITTLAKYQQQGPKEELVKRYLLEVVEDCGAQNQQIAEIILYLLTDKKGIRPFKTRSEIKRDLQLLNVAKEWDEKQQDSKLDLILQIFVESGIAVLIPENPDDCYQLVHDYLAAFIQKQQQPKLTDLIIKLNQERRQIKISEDKLRRVYKLAFISAAGTIMGLIILIIGVLILLRQ